MREGKIPEECITGLIVPVCKINRNIYNSGITLLGHVEVAVKNGRSGRENRRKTAAG